MRLTLRPRLALAIFAAVLGCRAVTTERPQPSEPSGNVGMTPSDLPTDFRTDSSSYGLRLRGGVWDAWARVTMVNRSSRPVYIERCHQMARSFVRPVERESKIEVGPECAGVGGVSHFEISTGEVFRDSIWLVRTRQNCLLEYSETSAAPHAYRVEYYVHDQPGTNDDDSPGERVFTNQFTISYCGVDPATGLEVCRPDCPAL